MAYYAFYKDFIIDNFLCIKCINVAAFMWPGYISSYTNGSRMGCSYNCKLYPHHKDLHVYCVALCKRLALPFYHRARIVAVPLSLASNEYVVERRYTQRHLKR